MTQGHPAFCGIGSLTMALNSLLLDPGRIWQGSWRWFDESMLDCCEPLDIVKLKGITLSKLGCLGRCNGAHVEAKYATNITLDEFRSDILKVTTLNSNNSRIVMVAAYSRPHLKQTGSGHFSPIGGYNEERDMVLIMDVARFKYPPHWVPLPALFEAMQAIDKETEKSRGYLLLQASEQMYTNCKLGGCAHTCEQGCGTDPEISVVNPSDDTVTQHERLKSLLSHCCGNCCH